MAEREVVVTLRLDNAQGIRNLGALKAELIAVSEKLKLETAIIKENGFATKTNERNVGTLIARQKALSSQIRELSNDLSGATAAGLRFRDKMADAARSGLGAFGLNIIGVTAAVGSAVAVLRDAGMTITEFQQSQANLAAILGKSRKEIAALTDSAVALGPALGRAPREVTALQTELAKLGFTEGQVLDAQEAVIQLANATGETLGRSAEVAASTLKGFGLEATDTQRLVDVMAQSFNSTALDLEKFGTAMSIIGPVSKTAGVSLEETTAIVGVLADRGVDASTIGTSLRDIFIDLSAKGLTLNEALGSINGSTDKVTAATDLFGKRSATTALILADNVGKIDELGAGLEDVAGVAQRVSDEQLNTLNGSFNKLGASWDAFVLSVESGEGVIGKALKSISNVLAGVLLGLSGQRADKSFQDLEERTELFSQRVNAELSKVGKDVVAGGFNVDEVGDRLEQVRIAVEQNIDDEVRLAKVRDVLGEKARQANQLAADQDRRQHDVQAALARATLSLFDEMVAARKKDAAEAASATQTTIAALNEETAATDKNTVSVRDNTAAREDALDALIRQNEEREKLLSQPVDTTPLDPLDLSLVPVSEEDLSGLDSLVERFAAVEDAQRRLADTTMQFSDDFGAAIGSMVTDAEGGARELLASVIKSVRAVVRLQMAQALATSLAQPDSVATFGASGLARFAILNAISEAFFSAALGAISGFREGGFTSRRGSDSVPVGVVHANEFVASAPTVRRMRPLFEWLDQYQRGSRPPRMPYQDGGFVAPTPTLGGMVSAQELGEARAMELSPMVSVEEINRVQQRVAVIERLSSR